MCLFVGVKKKKTLISLKEEGSVVIPQNVLQQINNLHNTESCRKSIMSNEVANIEMKTVKFNM